MTVKLLTEHYLEDLSLKGGCKSSFEATHVKKPHCWKSHIVAHFLFLFITHLVCSTRLGSIAVIEVLDWCRAVVTLEG